MELVLIRLMDMGFNGMFSDPHCRYTGGSGFNQTDTSEVKSLRRKKRKECFI